MYLPFYPANDADRFDEVRLGMARRMRHPRPQASVVAVEMDDDGHLDAVCERDGERQRIGLTNLPQPSPPPPGDEWIAAYRRWACGGRERDEEEE